MNAPTTIIEHPAFDDTTATSARGHFTRLTPNRQRDFLRSLQTFGNVRLACKTACVSAQTAYRARRASRGFALAWDAALVAARAHAEATLADRAINGVEEAVYYHGEEVARRRRYDSRLLLAHLARLDRLEEREEVSAALPLLDAAVDALDDGEEGADLDALLLEPTRAALNPQDSVPGVPSCRTWECEEAATIEERLCAMEAARPAHSPTLRAFIETLQWADVDIGAIEAAQLAAFEAGEADWWKAMPAGMEDALPPVWAAASGAGEGGGAGL